MVGEDFCYAHQNGLSLRIGGEGLVWADAQSLRKTNENL